MDFEGYKIKIQKASKLIEDAKCPEDILNNADYNLAEDFQYICLSSNINSEIVNEVIARLAQNGNKEIVEGNIKDISMGMWKSLFNKNDAIREIFINNFEKIIENAGILTYREIEDFVNDKETISCVYKNFKTIIKKLCTYDRAALIANIKTKENGVEKVKEYMESFLKKGEFDISTTYSKVLIELSDIPEIPTIEILEACTKNLKEMLERETAIDNETNELLSWVYNSMEETQMYNEQRDIFQKRIDDAIIENFDGILDKSNYDKETMKILKQFPCTIEKFEGNKNLFIEKSNKLIHMTKIYDFNYEKNNENTEDSEVIQNTNNGEMGEIIATENDANEKLEHIKDDANDEVEEINKYNDEVEEIDKYNDEAYNEIKSEVEALEEYAELIEQSRNTEGVNAQEIIDAIVKGNLYEADKIIDKIMQRDNVQEQNLQEKISAENVNEAECAENKPQVDSVNEIAKEKNCDEANKNIVNEIQEEKTEEVADNKSMIINEDNPIVIKRFVKVIKNLISKVKNIFAKYKTDKIGD